MFVIIIILSVSYLDCNKNTYNGKLKLDCADLGHHTYVALSGAWAASCMYKSRLDSFT